MLFFMDKKNYDEIEALYNQRKYDDVIAKVETLYSGKAIPLDIERKLALAYFYKEDYDNSLKTHLHIASRKETTDTLFNVMTSATMLKKIDLAREVFNKILATHRGAKSTGTGNKFMPQLCIPYIRYYYACGLADAECYDEAMDQVNELKPIYIQLKITDGTFLYIRGIPFFESFIQLAQKVFDGLQLDFVNSELIKELSSSVDTEGKEIIKQLCVKKCAETTPSRDSYTNRSSYKKQPPKS